MQGVENEIDYSSYKRAMKVQGIQMAACQMIVLSACLSFAAPSDGVSLTHRPTDESVCDLSPLTTYRLGLDPFVEAGTQNEQEIYMRLALRFVTTSCKDTQVLILHSDLGSAFDDGYFRAVAADLCSMANVKRESAGTAEYPEAFLLRCPISKMAEATAALASMEKARSTEAMIAEGAPDRSNVVPQPADRASKCEGGITLGMLLGIAGGRCR